MTRCYVHGIEYGGYQCPRCLDDDRHADAERRADEREEDARRRADERAEEARRAVEDSAQAAMDAAYRIANPGDYECPSCGFVTLKKDRPRCPKCHGEVTTLYWEAVHDRERVEEERRAAERQRYAAEQEAARARAQAEADRLAPIRERERAERARRAKTARRWSRITAPFCGAVFFFYLLPLLALLSGAFYALMHNDKLELADLAISNMWPYFIPLLNWLVMFAAVFLADDHAMRRVAFASLCIWALIGLGARVANRRAARNEDLFMTIAK